MEKKGLYPPITPYRTGFLPVGNGHQLYFEEVGNPKGNPIVFLHGGPGSGFQEKNRQFFDPAHYRIILFDQRGSGKSIPFSCLENNTTWDLVEDIDKLKNFLGIKQWVVFGGSWGSTLALAYAETYPQQVKGLILRGIFLCRKQELDWFYQSGAHRIFPEEWQRFIAVIPPEERGAMIPAYYKRLTAEDPLERKRAAAAWSRWEGMAAKLQCDPQFVADFTEDHHADTLSRIECSYFLNKAFFPTDHWLLENVGKIQHLPAVIIHGRYDMICPVENAWDLSQAWPTARLEIIPDAGHSASEPGMTDALIRATDAFVKL